MLSDSDGGVDRCPTKFLQPFAMRGIGGEEPAFSRGNFASHIMEVLHCQSEGHCKVGECMLWCTSDFGGQ
eukprot:6058324-Karenia_brevis.AAC.1